MRRAELFWLGNRKEVCVTTVEPVAKVYLQFQGKRFPEAFANAMRRFIETLETGKLFLCCGRDNLNAIAVIEAAYISLKEHREVKREEAL